MGYAFEEGTFSEIGMHVRHNCTTSAWKKKEIPGDGVVSGFGLVNGRPVACAASDFLAQGGSTRLHARHENRRRAKYS